MCDQTRPKETEIIDKEANLLCNIDLYSAYIMLIEVPINIL